MRAMFVLAHLSDPHLSPLPRPSLIELAGKRAAGYFNWRRNRHLRHRGDVLARIVTDLKAQTPDHIAVTGDLVNISLAGEYPPARLWLETLGLPGDVSLVPGNHDAYVRAAARAPVQHWGDFMRGDRHPEERAQRASKGDGGYAGASSFEASPPYPPSQAGEGKEEGVPQDHGIRFPFLRCRGSLALIGLSSAVPTLPHLATGRLGAAQLARLAQLLDECARAALFRVVLIHHPPMSKRSRYLKRLVDGASLREVLARHGAELVLHGHDHVHSLAHLAGPQRPIPVVGVPSASQAPSGGPKQASYNLYRIGGTSGAWKCEAISRGLSTDGETIAEIKRTILLGE
jgi:3',5'-cyclic AMP phosphodiesterase CpdA